MKFIGRSWAKKIENIHDIFFTVELLPSPYSRCVEVNSNVVEILDNDDDEEEVDDASACGASADEDMIGDDHDHDFVPPKNVRNYGNHVFEYFL